jgi:hypothetical protein
MIFAHVCGLPARHYEKNLKKTVGDNLHSFRSNSSTLIYEEESGAVLKKVSINK